MNPLGVPDGVAGISSKTRLCHRLRSLSVPRTHRAAPKPPQSGPCRLAPLGPGEVRVPHQLLDLHRINPGPSQRSRVVLSERVKARTQASLLHDTDSAAVQVSPERLVVERTEDRPRRRVVALSESGDCINGSLRERDDLRPPRLRDLRRERDRHPIRQIDVSPSERPCLSCPEPGVSQRVVLLASRERRAVGDPVQIIVRKGPDTSPLMTRSSSEVTVGVSFPTRLHLNGPWTRAPL